MLDVLLLLSLYVDYLPVDLLKTTFCHYLLALVCSTIPIRDTCMLCYFDYLHIFNHYKQTEHIRQKPHDYIGRSA